MTATVAARNYKDSASPQMSRRLAASRRLPSQRSFREMSGSCTFAATNNEQLAWLKESPMEYSDEEGMDLDPLSSNYIEVWNISGHYHSFLVPP